jgi:PAS domain S-box-containing protein
MKKMKAKALKPKTVVKKSKTSKPKPRKSSTKKDASSIPKAKGTSRIPLSAKKENQKEKAVIQDLKNRLLEAEETIEAIRSGGVDALVVSAPEGEQVYTLKGADYPYRVFFDKMNEGGAVISNEGLILACNKGFERFAGVDLEKLCGRSFYDFVPLEERSKFSHFIKNICETEPSKNCQTDLRIETVMLASGGKRVPIQLSLSEVHEIGRAHVCVVINDLTDQKRVEEILRRSNDELELKVKQRTAELELSREELKAHNEELQTTQEELQCQNEELRTTQEELQSASIALTDANKELEAFTYSASHDLRAPLRRMAGFAKIVLEDYADKLDTTGNDHLTRILGGSEKMLQLIDDLLHFSQLSRQEIKRGLIDMSKLASNIIMQLGEADPNRKVEFELKGDLTCYADHRLIEIVLSNLLGNAWKFTSKTENARIEFGVFNLNNVLTFFVRDNGVGFNPAYEEKLFHPFQRFHSDNEFEGTGIGLAIVERIIRLHGGKVWAEGETGKGATFFFTLN